MNKRLTDPIGHVEKAGLTVLGPPEKGARRDYDVYSVKYDCCGAEGTLQWGALRRRIYDEHKLCRKCSGVESGKRRLGKTHEDLRVLRESKVVRLGEEAYGVTPPSWPVPRRSLIGAHAPFYDRAGVEQ